MPPKKKDKQKKKTELSKTGEPAFRVCARFLKAYELLCQQEGCLPMPYIKSALKQAIEDEKFLTKMIVEPVPVNSSDDPTVKLEPLLNAMRRERYNYIKGLYVWELPMTNEEITALALLMEKSIYDIITLELMDNMIEEYGMRRFSKALPACPALLNLRLDYNEFGDAGCQHLCEGLAGNETMLSLSLNYCGLTAKSARCLGHMIATTALRDVFLDGNDLGCAGAEQILLPLVAKAEAELQERKQAEEAKLAAEAALKAAEEEAKANRFARGASPPPTPTPAPEKKSKKKKGKKKGKKAPPPPPAPGAWVHKLHLADNGIDGFNEGLGEFQSIQCMKLFRRLIASSECLQELDLEDNYIGDIGGNQLLDALIERKQVNSLPGVKLQTTHRMHTNTLKDLIKYGAGNIKKKKGKKKKK